VTENQDRRAVTEEAARETRRAEWTGLISRLQRELDDARDIARGSDEIRGQSGHLQVQSEKHASAKRPVLERYWLQQLRPGQRSHT